MTNPQAITLAVGDDGIAIATMDLPGRPMNVVNEHLMQPLAQIVETVAADPAIKGLILTSAKADFCAGGDLEGLFRLDRAQDAFDAVQAMKALLRRMETCTKPVVAAINGHALGGGLEISLACHARIVIDDPKLKLGQPEVKLGCCRAAAARRGCRGWWGSRPHCRSAPRAPTSRRPRRWRWGW